MFVPLLANYFTHMASILDNQLFISNILTETYLNNAKPRSKLFNDGSMDGN